MTAEIFYQCDNCLRYFSAGDLDPILIDPQPRFIPCVPISCICTRPDCKSIVAQNKRIDQCRLERRIGRREERIRPSAGKVSSHGVAVSNRLNSSTHAPDGGAFSRGCPKDTEFMDNPVMEAANRLRDSGPPSTPIKTPAHQDQVERFGERGEADNQNELMLLELRRSFDETRPERAGQWVNNARLKFQLKIGCPNNRAMDLRGGKRIKTAKGFKIRAPHPFIAKHGLDVDCSQIDNGGSDAQHFAYRLCLKSQSERLKREANLDVKRGQR